ncbi:gp11 [Burkholderia phage Bcep43]|uniref:Gp11 n=1 Tax=Burkholderia phage Bcep43 TaxID=2883945 RepID=Q6UKE0_9CAUD|nr:gp11 [Burkholderia phage Bcep43]AAR89302.1 gp11 [Burkholderia phage Bcep43]
MTPIEKLEQFALRLHAAGLDMAHIDLVAIIADLRAQFKPTDSPFDESAPANSQHFKTWIAITDALDGSGFDWRPRTPQTCAKDAAVAAIRSMAAQCSAQPPVADECPAGVPPLRQAKIGALSYAIGYLEARDRGAVALELSTLHAWLVANAPRT